MPQFLQNRESLFGFVLQCTLAVMLFELAATYSFYAFDVLLILLAALFLLVLFDRARYGGTAFIRDLIGRFGGFWMIPLMLLLYIIIDLVSVTYSVVPHLGFDKYKVVVLMLFLSACVLLYVDNLQKLRTILLTFGLASAFTALFTIVNYLFFHIYPVYYTMRLTLRTDYNVFASTLLLGLLCIFYLFVTTERTLRTCVLFVLDASLTLAVLFLSASRRIFLMLPFILGFWVCIYLVKSKSVRGVLSAIAVVLAVSTLFCFGTLGMQNYMRKQYLKYGSVGPTGSGGTSEGSAAERYETVCEGDFLSKRELIWKIAWDEFKGFTATQKFIGRGFAYDIALYDNVNNEQLSKEYANLQGKKGLLSAHNFILADLLDGGYMKAAIGIFMVGLLVWACFTLAFQSFATAAIYGNLLAVVVLNNLVSNRYGLLYDKFFYLFAVMMLLHLRYLRTHRKELFGS